MQAEQLQSMHLIDSSPEVLSCYPVFDTPTPLAPTEKADPTGAGNEDEVAKRYTHFQKERLMTFK